MKNKKITIALLIAIVCLLLGGALIVILMQTNGKKSETDEVEKVAQLGTFGEISECEIFFDVPIMDADGVSIGSATDYGEGNYIIDMNGSDLEDYKNYLTTLEGNGFKKHSDNGQDGMDGYIYTASYQKNELTLTVTHIVKMDKTYVAACENLPLSEHLNYSEEYMIGAQEGAQTKVHMPELNWNGNSFIIQLKNGHFIVEDGGNETDTLYLLDYLESLVPEGEKPVVEAWFMSHAHSDHYGVLKTFIEKPQLTSRIYVEGFYYVPISDTMIDMFTSEKSLKTSMFYVLRAANAFKTQSGEMPKLYRPQPGQRYYFGDMSIDIPLTADLFTKDTWHTPDFNDTSTWLMHNIEGQRFLHAGDAGIGATKLGMMLYDEEYFDVDIFSVLHHGINVYDYFTDYCTIDTLLYTCFREASMYEPSSKYSMVAQNEHLKESVLEYVSHGEGTVVLTFPYKVGTYEKMPASDWRYNIGKKPVRELLE